MEGGTVKTLSYMAFVIYLLIRAWETFGCDIAGAASPMSCLDYHQAAESWLFFSMATALLAIMGMVEDANDLHTDRQLWARDAAEDAARRANKKPSRWFW